MFIYVYLFLMYHMICDFVMIIKIKLIDLIFCFILLFVYNLLSYDLRVYDDLNFIFFEGVSVIWLPYSVDLLVNVTLG